MCCMKKRKRLWSILICCMLLLSGIPQTVSAKRIQERSTGTSVTVSTPEQFEKALNNSSVTDITVSKRITLCGTAESSDYSISPVMIRGGVTIKGSADGSGILTLRSPIQLTGDNVTFQNIEMNFISSGALGSVPHREIFLAGHTLTLDNVSCYTKGSDGSLGGFGGNEAELLPTVYAGGYRNTEVNQNGAGLTVKNSNDKTNIQAIYAGHDQGKDNKVPYTGSMDVNIDSRAAVRDGIFASANTGKVNIIVTGEDKNSCRTKYFEGNEHTTVTFDNISVNRIPVKGGNIVLQKGAIFEPVAKGEAAIDSIEVKQETILNLASMPGTVVKGDFKGGGTLVLDKDDSLTIKGAVSGETTFKTWGGSLAGNGSLVDGKAYITCAGDSTGKGSFKLDQGHQNYSFEQKNGVWTAKNTTPAENREFGSFKVLSSPGFVDYDVVAKESLSNDTIEPSQIFVTETRDINGEVYIPEEEFNVYVLRAKDVEPPKSEDWGTDIFIMELGNLNNDFEGKYYVSFGVDSQQSKISDKVTPGKYKVFFTKNAHDSGTVGEIIKDAVGSAEFTIYKKEGTASKKITTDHISPIPDRKYTGKEIKPSVTVTVDGTTLTEGTDYILKYENNINVTTGTSSAKVIVEGIGNYGGQVEVPFKIVKGQLDTTNALSAEKKEYTYGDTVKLSFTAEPAQNPGKQFAARNAQEETVKFYCGNTLLGTANVVNGKATFIYDTAKRQIPVGKAAITAEFSGNDRLEPAEFTVDNLFTLKKKDLKPDDIQSIFLEDFVYDGKKKTTEITGITWNGSSIADLTFEGTAELSGTDAKSYDTANITKLSLTGESSKWYAGSVFNETISNVTVSPQVVIRKAASVGNVFKTLTFDQNANSGELIFDKTIIPDDFEVVSAVQGDQDGFGNLISNVKPTNTKVTFDLAKDPGEGTIPVILTFKNHEDIHLEIKVVKTSKIVVNPKFKAPDVEYTGSSYDAWSVVGYDKKNVNASYYDIDKGETLKNAPENAGNYSVTLRLNSGTDFAEETLNFTIGKRKTVLQALDRQIKIGGTAPDLSSPKEGVDYQFTSGGPVAGDSIGLIKMAYDQTPTTAQAGTHAIRIGIVGSTNENYSVETKDATLTVTKEEPPQPPTPPVTPEEPPTQPQEYQITVNGGTADASSAAAGQVVTITAQEPEGQTFVRWNTASEGVVLENAQSPKTTFVMPENDVTITAEFNESEQPKPEEPETIPVEKVTLNHSRISLKAGETAALTASVTPSDATDKKVSWSTSNSQIASVDQSGRITAKKAGQAVITAKAGEKSASCTITVSLAAPAALKTKITGTGTIALTWNSVKGADGYEIYRTAGKSKTYKKIASVKGKTAYIDKKKTVGTAYTYKVRAYSGKIYSAFSKAVKTMARPFRPALSLKAGKRQIQLSWKGVKGADGYQIYRSASKNGKYTKIAEASAGKRTFVNKGLKSGKKYYYKMRAYERAGGKRVYSHYSEAKMSKVK